MRDDLGQQGEDLAAGAERKRGVLSEAEQQELIRRFLLRDRQAEHDLALHLNRLLYRVYEQRWKRSGLPFLDVRGECFVLLARWREEKKVRVEPLPHLAQRLMKQSGRQLLRGAYHDAKVVSLDEGWEDRGDPKLRGLRERRELQASVETAPRDPEQDLLAKELYDWLLRAPERLSELHRATFDALLQVDDGEAPSLAAALEIREDAAKQRRHRLRVALVELAVADGMDTVVQRGKHGRAPRRDRKEASA